jgi:hypothetical protein
MSASLRGLGVTVFAFGVACSSSSDAPGAAVDGAVDTIADVGSDAAVVDADVLDDAASETSACTSGLAQPTPACQSCQDAHCCIVASDCAATKSKWSCSAVKVCLSNNCATECGTAAPTCGDIIPDPASCTDATRAACCDQLTACAHSDECLALIYMCIDEQSCDPTKPCFKACRDKWPAGSPLFSALDKCGGTVSCP